MAALQYVHVPGYAALLFRRSYPDLALPGALMSRSHEWLDCSEARWMEKDKTWRFPSGATITFGYMEVERHKYRYQGAQVQFVGFDELTQFSETQYTYLFSRLRKLTGSEVPLRMRGATNPGGVGHEWVRARFIDCHLMDERVFVPARLTDNCYLDQESYVASLGQLDHATRLQLLEGDWDAMPEGVMFKREWFEGKYVEPEHVPTMVGTCRYWDKAGTEGGTGARSAGVKVGKDKDGKWYIMDSVFGRWSALERERVIKATAEADGIVPSVWVEQEPGSGGKESAESTVRNLAGWNVHAETVSGDKVTRARPLSAQCEAGNVFVVRGPWNHEYLWELCSFPAGLKDQVDASSGAFNKLSRGNQWTAEDIAAYGAGGSGGNGNGHGPDGAPVEVLAGPAVA